jgi:hypothetical protein
MSKEERQQCVGACVFEGHTVHQMSQLFQCSEKTISRDLAAIRERNAMTPNVEFVKQLVGDVYQKVMSHHDYLVRLAKSKESDAAEKISAITVACHALIDLVELLQSVGYMPSRPQRIVGDLYHHDADEKAKSLTELRNELLQFEQVVSETGALDEHTKLQIKLIEKRIEEAEITQQLLVVKEGEKDQNSNDAIKEVPNDNGTK